MSVMKFTTVEAWEKQAIWELTLKFLIAGILGTFLCFVLAAILINYGYGRFVSTSGEMLLIPWALIVVFGTSIAFHQGVVDEYRNVMGEWKDGDKEAPHLTRPAQWEQAEIQQQTVKQIMFAAIGTLALLGAASVVKDMGWGELDPILIFLPWVFIWILETSKVYHHGVIAMRIKLRGRRDADRRLGPRRGGSDAGAKKTGKKAKSAEAE